MLPEEDKRVVVWWNCCGGMRSKHDIITHYCLQHKPDLFFISEANIKEKDNKMVLNVQDYELIHTTFNEVGMSRLACLVRINAEYEVSSFKTDNNEILVLESKTKRFVGIYRPFTNHNGATLGQNFDRLVSTLSKLQTDDKDTIVGGDFNLDALKTNINGYKNSSQLLRMELWSTDAGLSQHINVNTRRRCVNTQEGVRVEEACLDHLYGPEIGFTYSVMHIPGSDHDAVCASWITKHIKTTKVVFRDWKNYGHDTLERLLNNDHMLNENLCYLDYFNDSDSLAAEITKIHNYIFNKLCPERVARTRGDDFFVDNQIEKLKKKRDRALIKYRKTSESKYLWKADGLSKSLKKAIIKVAQRRIQVKATSPNPKVFWGAIKEASGKLRQKETLRLQHDNILIDSPCDVAELLADFFVQKAQTLSEKTVPEEGCDDNKCRRGECAFNHHRENA